MAIWKQYTQGHERVGIVVCIHQEPRHTTITSLVTSGQVEHERVGEVNTNRWGDTQASTAAFRFAFHSRHTHTHTHTLSPFVVNGINDITDRFPCVPIPQQAAS